MCGWVTVSPWIWIGTRFHSSRWMEQTRPKWYVLEMLYVAFSLFGWLVHIVAGSWRSTTCWFVWEKNTVPTENLRSFMTSHSQMNMLLLASRFSSFSRQLQVVPHIHQRWQGLFHWGSLLRLLSLSKATIGIKRLIKLSQWLRPMVTSLLLLPLWKIRMLNTLTLVAIIKIPLRTLLKMLKRCQMLPFLHRFLQMWVMSLFSTHTSPYIHHQHALLINFQFIHLADHSSTCYHRGATIGKEIYLLIWTIHIDNSAGKK